MPRNIPDKRLKHMVRRSPNVKFAEVWAKREKATPSDLSKLRKYWSKKQEALDRVEL